MAKDTKMDKDDDKKYFGIPVIFEEEGWKVIENSRVTKLS